VTDAEQTTILLLAIIATILLALLARQPAPPPPRHRPGRTYRPKPPDGPPDPEIMRRLAADLRKHGPIGGGGWGPKRTPPPESDGA